LFPGHGRLIIDHLHPRPVVELARTNSAISNVPRRSICWPDPPSPSWPPQPRRTLGFPSRTARVALRRAFGRDEELALLDLRLKDAVDGQRRIALSPGARHRQEHPGGRVLGRLSDGALCCTVAVTKTSLPTNRSSKPSPSRRAPSVRASERIGPKRSPILAGWSLRGRAGRQRHRDRGLATLRPIDGWRRRRYPFLSPSLPASPSC